MGAWPKGLDQSPLSTVIQIGARFLQEQASMNPPNDVQHAFFVEDYEKEVGKKPIFDF